MRKYPWLRGPISVGLFFLLLILGMGTAVTSNMKKLVSLAVLMVFFTISCSFCAPMFQLAPEQEMEVDTEHLVGEDIMLASEEAAADVETVEEISDEISENPEITGDEDLNNYSAEEILALHNLEEEEDAEVPEGSEVVSKDDWSLILVNARHPIPEDYEFTLGTIKGNLQCDERIIPDLLKMLQAAKNDGVSLEVCSPYRTEDRQEMLFDRKINHYMKKGMSYIDAYKVSAPVVNVPGSSEHQIGLSLDIYSDSYRELDEGFGDTEAGIWLREHCGEYGFILRYPKGKEYITGIIYEPWHFRYVGKTAATEIMEQGITLEEYIDTL